MTFTGLYVPLITPFDAAGAVALDALEALAHRVIDDGATGLVALGTTAEPGSLSDAEQRAVVDVAARVCRERGAPLLVGAATPAALEVLRDRPEVAAALSVVPPFTRPGEAGVLAYVSHLTTVSPVPLVIYHVEPQPDRDQGGPARPRQYPDSRGTVAAATGPLGHDAGGAASHRCPAVPPPPARRRTASCANVLHARRRPG